MDPELYRMTIPLYIVTLLGIWMTAEYFFPFLNPLVPASDAIRAYASIAEGAAWGVGTAILTVAHLRRIYRQSKDPFWGYSVVYCVFFFVMFLLGIFEGLGGANFNWLLKWLIQPGDMALYSTTAFYVTTAGYRVFRFRNLDAAALLISGMFIMWSVLPLFTGPAPWIVPIAGWINNVPAVACYRGFVIGVALGIIGLSLRVWLLKHREVLA